MDDKPAKDASLAGGVITELREGGELHSEGQFTMDREVARQKLSELQLHDPRWSLLLLARAAVRRVASRLDVEVDADDIRFSFDGRGFDDMDFENLYHDPFSERVDETHAGRRELALGLIAALSLEPRFIRVRSGQVRWAPSWSCAPASLIDTGAWTSRRTPRRCTSSWARGCWSGPWPTTEMCSRR